MNPLDHKKNWMAFLSQLKAQIPLQPEQFDHLAKVFEEILVNDIDADVALGLAYPRGHSKNDALARQKLSRVLHWIACATDADPIHDVPPLSLNKAFTEASKLFRGFTPVRLRKEWYDKKNAHMRDPIRGHFDPDSPF